MFGSHERVLVIDGDFIHVSLMGVNVMVTHLIDGVYFVFFFFKIMPSATKALLDSLKTSSYHIRTVVKCNLSKKASASVKLIVRRESGDKRYDFEAENAQLAGKIKVRRLRDMFN